MEISVKTVQHVHQHEQRSTFTNEASGTLLAKRSPYIFYTETLDEFEIEVRVKLDPNGIRILRSGSVKMDFLFVLGETTQNMYETPAGRTVMDVLTTKCELTQTENSGRLELHYELSERGQSHGKFEYTLEYKERTL